MAGGRDGRPVSTCAVASNIAALPADPQTQVTPVSRMARPRKWSIELPGGSAGIELAYTGAEVELRNHFELATSKSTGGYGRWKRCVVSGCVGEAIPGGSCFRHSERTTRQDYVRANIGNDRGHITLNGNEVDAESIAVLMSLGDTIRCPVSFCGAEIQAPLDLRGRCFERHIDFSGADIFAPVRCQGVVFKHQLLMEFTRFLAQHAEFAECEVVGEVRMRGAVASPPVLLSFANARLCGGLESKGAQVNLNLDGSSHDGVVNFDECKFSHLSMAHTVFAKHLSMKNSTARSIDASGVHVLGTCELKNVAVEDSLVVDDAMFERRANLEVVASHINMKRVRLEHGGRFSLGRARVSLEGLQTGDPLIIEGIPDVPQPKLVSLEACDAERLTLSNADLTFCSMYRAHGLDRISIETSVSMLAAPRLLARRRYIADELYFRLGRGRFSRFIWRRYLGKLGGFSPGERSAAQLIATYRALRRAAERGANGDIADDFYYGEMEMRRLDHTRSCRARCLHTLYWLVSGYGLKFGRALFATVILIALSAEALRRWGFEPSGSYVDGLLFATRALVPGIRPAGQINRLGSVIEVILAILGPSLFALMVLAVRNQVRRMKGA